MQQVEPATGPGGTRALPLQAAAARSPIFVAAEKLADHLAAGQALGPGLLRDAMTTATGLSDAEGGWIWKQAYDAAEAAVVLLLRQYGQGMRTKAATDHEPAQALLRMIQAVAALEPSQTRRSAEQIRFQQFSTPLAMALAAAYAAQPQARDCVLEPSAGTGTLAATIRLLTDQPPTFVLNEYAAGRAALLQDLFADARVLTHDAGSLADRAPDVRPDIVIMNPPFSRTPGRETRVRHTDIDHIAAAFAMLPPGGRLVAITGGRAAPGSATWHAALGEDQRIGNRPADVVFSAPIAEHEYARHGTTFPTRLTVIDQVERPATSLHAFDPLDASDLLAAIQEHVPGRARIRPNPRTAAFALPSRSEGLRRRKRASADVVIEGHWPDPEPLNVQVDDTVQGTVTPGTTDRAYVGWKPDMYHVPGAHRHPTPLVQSAAMAAVRHRVTDYRPILPARLVHEGILSDAELESVILAGAAHNSFLGRKMVISQDWRVALPYTGDGTAVDALSDDRSDGDSRMVFEAPVEIRQGWMLGDGTGTGKGREVAGIILDNWLRGRQRAIWLSESDKLLEDARRDWTALGGHADQIFELSRHPTGKAIERQTGILFTTYSTFRQPERRGRPSRLEQIVDWAAGGTGHDERTGFEGVIALDECHALANAGGTEAQRGRQKPSAQGLAGLRLQNALPRARVLYVSATGATRLRGLTYATRLGLWGTLDTPFESRQNFISTMEAGGVAALEVVARDLKSMGLYQARALSYEGVEVEILEHDLTEEQIAIYNQYADAFHVIHDNIERALRDTGTINGENRTANPQGKSAAISAFEGAKQRFFSHLLTGMKCPAMFADIDRQLDRGHACIVQLVSTGEALMERRLADIPPSEWNDIRVDLTPREYILDYLRNAFPIILQEEYSDSDGATHARPARTAEGDLIVSQEAVQRRDALLLKLATLPPVQSALDQLIQRFGAQRVAEVTGRSRRIIPIEADGRVRLAVRPRPGNANLTDANAFLAGTKEILVFSNAGGTGRSYHADKTFPNHKRRVHYLLEAGWRADKAIQGLGRSNRTHQVAPPIFRPVTTNVRGERRFIASISARLDSLGAITRGQRDSQAAMGDTNTRLFHESDNLESSFARAALRSLYVAIENNQIPDWSIGAFEQKTGLRLQNEEGQLKTSTPPMHQFLNRLVALRIDDQNSLFAALEARIASNIEIAKEAGTYELGVEVMRARSFDMKKRTTLFTHPRTGAETELVTITRTLAVHCKQADEAIANTMRRNGRLMLLQNDRSGHVAALWPASAIIDEKTGRVVRRCYLVRPTSQELILEDRLEDTFWRRIPRQQWVPAWEQACATSPTSRQDEIALATGLLLPVWDRFNSAEPEPIRVRRLTTSTGESILGRLIPARDVYKTLKRFGAGGHSRASSTELINSVKAGNELTLAAAGLTVRQVRTMHRERIEVVGDVHQHAERLQRCGCTTEIVAWQARYIVPNADTLEAITKIWPVTSETA